jgi:hypothetical protein
MKTNQQNGSQMEFKQKINEELMRISDTVWSTNSKVRDQFCQAKKKKKVCKEEQQQKEKTKEDSRVSEANLSCVT